MIPGEEVRYCSGFNDQEQQQRCDDNPLGTRMRFTNWAMRILQCPSNFVAMPLCVVFVSFTVFFVSCGFMRAVAERLVLRKAAHANPD